MKRGRGQDDEVLMDGEMEGLDEDTVRKILRLLIRATLRHEQQFTRWTGPTFSFSRLKMWASCKC